MALLLNHISIRTTDIEATRHFYVDVLGLQVGPRPDFPFPRPLAVPGPADGICQRRGARDRHRPG